MNTGTNVKVSVIVPVYNAEKYLCRCIESVLGQTMPDLELLLIDDGSTDQSLAICREYERQDSRVRVLAQPNRGVGAVRRLGITQAKGEYSIHVDSDDWIEPDHLQTLVCETEHTQADITLCDFIEDNANEHTVRHQRPSSLDRMTVLHELLLGTLHGSVCNKLIRNECYRQTDVNFEEGVNSCEDLLVVVSLIWKKPDIRLGYVAKATYHYDRSVNANSMTISRQNARAKLLGCIHFVSQAESMLDHTLFAIDILIRKREILREAFYNQLLSASEFAQIGKGIKDSFSVFHFHDSLDFFVAIALHCNYDMAHRLFAFWQRFRRKRRN